MARGSTIKFKPRFFFNDTATTEIYTLSLHDALPISARRCARFCSRVGKPSRAQSLNHSATSVGTSGPSTVNAADRSEEHTSELQSRQYIVCRLLLEKK